MYIHLNDIKQHVDEQGADQSPAFVFLHYFGGSARSWTEVIEALTGQARCIAPDLRGFGHTQAPAGGYAIDDYADDIAALVDAFALQDWILVGHSMGGKIALALAARRPPGLRAVVLIAPSPPVPEPMADDERQRLLDTHGERAAALETVENITHRALSPFLLERAIEDNLRSSPAAWRAWLEHGSQEDISQRMSAINVPVSVLVGRNDPVMARSLLQHEVAERTHGTLTIASDEGHLLPLESPQAIVRALLEFLPGANPDPGRYPSGTTRRLLETDLLTAPTREALTTRLAGAGVAAPRFFDARAYATLRAACARLIPQADELPGSVACADLAASIDGRLADGRSDGWRYDGMPADGEAYRLGLEGLDASGQAMFNADFVSLPHDEQDAVLGAVQKGTVQHGAGWNSVCASRFFEGLLAECVQAYYSEAVGQDEIGYVGYADAHGWQAIGLDELAMHEPRPLLEGKND